MVLKFDRKRDPIGVTQKTWPRGKHGPMHHVLTLETRVLSDEARDALGDAAAVALFLADIDEPAAGSAVVPLSASELRKASAPEVASTIDGVRLDLHEIPMPKAVFRGGKKTGTLRELRVALDRLDGTVATDVASPRWIQDPEHWGPLLLQFDARFAPKLNFGDQGALYVFPDDIVFQCG